MLREVFAHRETNRLLVVNNQQISCVSYIVRRTVAAAKKFSEPAGDSFQSCYRCHVSRFLSVTTRPGSFGRDSSTVGRKHRWIGRRQHCDQAGSTIQLSKYAAHTSGRVWTICMGGCKAEHHWGQVAWLNYSASRAAPGRRGGATAIPGRLPCTFPDRKNPKSCVKGRRNLEVQG